MWSPIYMRALPLSTCYQGVVADLPWAGLPASMLLWSRRCLCETPVRRRGDAASSRNVSPASRPRMLDGPIAYARRWCTCVRIALLMFLLTACSARRSVDDCAFRLGQTFGNLWQYGSMAVWQYAGRSGATSGKRSASGSQWPSMLPTLPPARYRSHSHEALDVSTLLRRVRHAISRMCRAIVARKYLAR